tara:strand:+ start:1466 stop:1762 length:297 start_codon:yes stop_codon:yes gene_type:complete
MKFKLPWSYWLKKQRKDKPPRPILATEVTYEEELLVEIALRVVMKNTPDTEDVGDLLSSLARENFRLNKVVDQVANYAECLEDELDSLIPSAKNTHNP